MSEKDIIEKAEKLPEKNKADPIGYFKGFLVTSKVAKKYPLEDGDLCHVELVIEFHKLPKEETKRHE